MKCFSIEMTVDSDLTNYNDLVGSVVNKYPLGYMEVVHVQYYDEVLKSFPEITTDQQLMTMFSKHFKSKVIIMFIAYCGPSDVFEPISEWDCTPATTAKKKRKSDDCTPATSKRYLSLLLKI
jgi:hypothetical protein